MKVLQALIIVSIFSIVNLAFAQSNNNKEIRKFDLIDGDKNEVITIREMIFYYKDKINEEGEATDAKKMFYGLDANENSIITLDEFVKGVDWKLAYEFVDDWDKKDEVIPKNKTPKKDIEIKQLTYKFKTLDTDNSNMLSMAEVVIFYEGFKNETTGEPLNGKLNFYAHDFNNDGKIVIEEFLKKPDLNLGSQRLKDSEKMKTALVKAPSVKAPSVKTASVKEPSVKTASLKNAPSKGYVKKRIKLFSFVDTDSNNKVTLLELQNYYKGKTNKKGNPVNAKFRFYGLDTNDNGTLELSEFSSKIDLELAKKKYKGLKQ